MEALQYRGRTEDDRLEAAIFYDRIRNMIERMQRTGFPLTTGDIEALNFCVDVLVVTPAAVQEPATQAPRAAPPAPVQELEPEPAPTDRPGRRIRQV